MTAAPRKLWITCAMMAGFGLFIALSLLITWLAARRTNSTEDFLAAGRSVTGWQNGLALAGDYMSAASFLGIAGLVAAFITVLITDVFRIIPIPEITVGLTPEQARQPVVSLPVPTPLGTLL